MKIWRAILVDDEPFARMELKRLLSDYDFVHIIGECHDLASAKDAVIKLSPDLIFLDIDLGRNTGFDLLEQVAPTFQTIFITAYNEFAIRAFEVNALDYLLKPVHPDRLKESIKRLGSPYKEEQKIELKPFDKILINQHTSSQFITVDSISYIEAKGDYTKVCTQKNVGGVLHQTIKKWNEKLPHDIFFQVHRSFIVNLNHIEELINKDSNRYDIQLKNLPILIPVSKSYSKIIRDKYIVK